MFGSTGVRTGYGPSRPARRARCSLASSSRPDGRGAAWSGEPSLGPFGRSIHACHPDRPFARPTGATGLGDWTYRGRLQLAPGGKVTDSGCTRIHRCCLCAAMCMLLRWVLEPALPLGGPLTTPSSPRGRTDRQWRFRVRSWAFARCARTSSWLQKPARGVRQVSPIPRPGLGTRSSSRPRGRSGEQMSRSPPVTCRRTEGPWERAPGWWKAPRTVGIERPSRGGSWKRSRSTAGCHRGSMTEASEVSRAGPGRGQQPSPKPTRSTEAGRAP